MANEVLADSITIPLSQSSLSDDDAVNTDSARVYFGPLRSPEKKFTQDPHISQPTPVRRFTRHSTTSLLLSPRTKSAEGHQIKLDLNDVRDEDSTERSRVGTPIEDIMDEPPSALASKIMRAWDNPSPPPRSPSPIPLVSQPLTTRTSRTYNLNNVFVDVSATPLSPDAETKTGDSMSAVDLDASTEPVALTDAALLDMLNDTPEPDLITFDSFSTSHHLPGPPVPTNISSVRKTLTTHSTVDDLLSLSPERSQLTYSKPASNPGHLQLPNIPSMRSSASTGEVTPSVDEEEQVLKVLAIDTQDNVTIPSSEALVSSSQNDHEPVLVNVITTVDSGVHTPLRRSSRPRRSVSPLVLPLFATNHSDQNAHAQQPLGATIPGPARKKSVKGKEKEVLHDLGMQFDTEIASTTEVSRRKKCSDLTKTSSPRVTVENQTPEVEVGPVDGDHKATKVTKDKGRRQRESRPHRELGSLSPTSADVLMQLLPTVSGSDANVKLPANGPQDTDNLPTETIPHTPPAQSSPTVQYNDTPAASQTLRPPPSQPPPSQLHDPTRTPARRIPIAQAIAQGTVSPQKNSFLLPRPIASAGIGLMRSPFRRMPVDDPARSPAKRIPIGEAITALTSSDKSKVTLQLRSTLKAAGRSRSEEPQPLGVRKKERSASLEPSRPRASTSLAGNDTLFKGLSSFVPAGNSVGEGNDPLPFPLIPKWTTGIIAEETEDDLHPHSSVPASSSPAKPTSSLRQPTSRTESRIPRIGAKPYARPTPKPALDRYSTSKGTQFSTRKVAPSPEVATATPSKPIVIRRATGKPSMVTSGNSSDDSSSSIAAPPAPKTVVSRAPALPTVAQSPNVATLKRKREEESKASPPGARPVVLMRKVVSNNKQVPPKPSPRPALTKSPAKARITLTRPAPAQGKIKMRKVVDVKKSDAAIQQPGLAVVKEISPVPKDSSPVPESVLIVGSPSLGSTGGSPNRTHDPTASSELNPLPTSENVPPIAVAQTFLRAESEEDESYTSSLRRTTRSRKSAQPMTDVFGTIASTSVRPLQPRRRPAPPPDSGVFAGMTALALKSLTTTNTLRNQQQVAEIRTEVIRKEGSRPDSPTTKVRTVLERQKEVKIQQRQDRAERRARRGAGGSTMNGDSVNEGEDCGEVGDMSMMSVERDATSIPVRHRRGPGEDEDYETPPRPDRPLKRGRFDGDNGIYDEKRVKWDRGLATTVYLDDSPPKPRRPREDLIKKGCLTPAAKILRLDTMGNLLDVDAPLSGLVSENVVVKKFVYDEDILPDPPVTPVAKVTRGKSKKAKS